MHIHVLVVEDNFDLAGTVIDYLEAAGVVCDHARDGQAGLNLARANRYDVILLDIMLPRINGRQVCRQLREAGLQTPVLMLTALDTLQDKLDGFDAGADDYLLKPFELPELLVRLQAPEAGPPPHARAHGDALPDPDSCGNAHAGAVPRFHAAAQRRAGAGRRGPHPQRDAQAGQRRRLCGTGRRQHPKQHRAHRR